MHLRLLSLFIINLVIFDALIEIYEGIEINTLNRSQLDDGAFAKSVISFMFVVFLVLWYDILFASRAHHEVTGSSPRSHRDPTGSSPRSQRELTGMSQGAHR